jgi:hypothetical protein
MAPELVVVTWRDAWFDFADDEVRDDYLVRTVGFVVADGPRFVSVAQELLPDEDGFRAVTHIPRGMITEVRRLDRGVIVSSTEGLAPSST